MSGPDIELRLLQRNDFYKGMAEPVTWEINGLTALVDGEIAGYAGAHRFGRHYWIFFNAFDGRVLRPFFLHRLVREVIAGYDRVGLRPLYSISGARDVAQERADRWNSVLGFRPVRDDEKDDEISYVERVNNLRAWIRS